MRTNIKNRTIFVRTLREIYMCTIKHLIFVHLNFVISIPGNVVYLNFIILEIGLYIYSFVFNVRAHIIFASSVDSLNSLKIRKIL